MEKYFTPEVITLLTNVTILLIILIVNAIVLLLIRNTIIGKKIIWFLKEVAKLFSNSSSFFSQKRIRGTVAFNSMVFILLHHYWFTRLTISTAETCEMALIFAGICGYHLSKTQEEKLANKDTN